MIFFAHALNEMNFPSINKNRPEASHSAPKFLGLNAFRETDESFTPTRSTVAATSNNTIKSTLISASKKKRKKKEKWFEPDESKGGQGKSMGSLLFYSLKRRARDALKGGRKSKAPPLLLLVRYTYVFKMHFPFASCFAVAVHGLVVTGPTHSPA